MDVGLKFHSAAPLAALVHSASLPYRAKRTSASMHGIATALAIQDGLYLAAASLAAVRSASTDLYDTRNRNGVAVAPLSRCSAPSAA